MICCMKYAIRFIFFPFTNGKVNSSLGPYDNVSIYQVKVCGVLQGFENRRVDGWQGDHLQLSAEWVSIRVLITLVLILNDKS